MHVISRFTPICVYPSLLAELVRTLSACRSTWPGCLLAVLAQLTAPAAGGLMNTWEIYEPPSNEAMRGLADMGFNRFVLQNWSLSRDAAAMGASVVLEAWWDTGTPASSIDAAVAAAAAANASCGGCVASLNAADEPLYNSLAAHPPRLYRNISTRHPSTKFSLTFHGPDHSYRWNATTAALLSQYMAAVQWFSTIAYLLPHLPVAYLRHAACPLPGRLD
eukprot:gene4478-4721_t